jgi:hypothetical protein
MFKNAYPTRPFGNNNSNLTQAGLFCEHEQDGFHIKGTVYQYKGFVFSLYEVTDDYDGLSVLVVPADVQPIYNEMRKKSRDFENIDLRKEYAEQAGEEGLKVRSLMLSIGIQMLIEARKTENQH